MPKVPAAAEEAREEVEGVVVLCGSAAATLVLFYAVVAVLVVYPACFFVDEDFVGFGYCDEFVMGGVISSVVMLASGGICGEW